MQPEPQDFEKVADETHFQPEIVSWEMPISTASEQKNDCDSCSYLLHVTKTQRKQKEKLKVDMLQQQEEIEALRSKNEKLVKVINSLVLLQQSNTKVGITAWMQGNRTEESKDVQSAVTKEPKIVSSQ